MNWDRELDERMFSDSAFQMRGPQTEKASKDGITIVEMKEDKGMEEFNVGGAREKLFDAKNTS